MSYVDEVLAEVNEKNPAEPEFHQAAKEVLESLRPVVEQTRKNSEKKLCLRDLLNRKDRLSSVFLGLMIKDRYR